MGTKRLSITLTTLIALSLDASFALQGCKAGDTRTDANAPLFDAASQVFSAAKTVKAPTAEHPLTEFTVTVGDDGEPAPGISPQVVSFERYDPERFLVVVNAEHPSFTGDPEEAPVLNLRRVTWRLGEPQPACIAALGIEVVS